GGQLPQPRVRREAPADDERVAAGVLAGGQRLAHEDVGDGLREGGGDVGGRELLTGVLHPLDIAGDRRLEPGEGEVVRVADGVLAPRQTAGEADRRAVPALREAVDVRAA